MKLNNVCQECGKRHSKVPKQCMCGWFFIKEDAQLNDPSLCQFIHSNGKQCEESGRIAISPKSSNWYCRLHYELMREESYKR